jgi:hypothetical protein
MKYITAITIGIFIIGTIMFLVGFHNIDNGYNMALLDEWENEYFVDGSIRNSNKTYLYGVQMQILGYCCFLISFLLPIIGDIELPNIFKSENPKN